MDRTFEQEKEKTIHKTDDPGNEKGKPENFLMSLSSPLPEDIKTCWYEPLLDWLKIIRRLQSDSRKQGGFGILTIKVVVNQDGIPVIWSDPKMTLVEPKRRSPEEIMLLLAEGENG